jgi:hypothetical protein
MPINGINFYGKLSGDDTGYTAADDLQTTIIPGSGGDTGNVLIQWFSADEYWCRDGTSPSTMLQLWYGGLNSADDTGYYGSRVYVKDGGSVVDASATAGGDYRRWLQTSTTAVLVAATITNLPPISIDGDLTIGGFLDYKKKWGFDYDVDVQYMNWNSNFEDLSPDGFKMETIIAEGGNHDVFVSAWASSVLSDEGVWHSATPSSGYSNVWPSGRMNYPALHGIKTDNLDSIGYATTVTMEALGFDAHDSLVLETMETSDANEALHSNEVVKFIPGLEISEEESLILNDPSISSHRDLSGMYEITWTEKWQTRAAMAKRYHALHSPSDPATQPAGWFMDYDGAYSYDNSDGVMLAEESAMLNSIDEACQLIGPELEVVSFPKRLINHVQKRRKIPDNLVSAFGYVPEDMYDPSTLPEELGDTTGEESAIYGSTGTAMADTEQAIDRGGAPYSDEPSGPR